MKACCACCGEEDAWLSHDVAVTIESPVRTRSHKILLEIKMRGIVRGTTPYPDDDRLCPACWEKLYARLKEALPEEDPDFPKETP